MKAALIECRAGGRHDRRRRRRRRAHGSRSGFPAAGGRLEQLDVQGNTPYDGRFVFIRLRYNTGFGGGSAGAAAVRRGRTTIRAAKCTSRRSSTRSPTCARGSTARTSSALDDPELFKYPIAYMAEPGFWSMTEKETDELPRLPEKGRLRDLRRLPRQPRGTGTTCSSRCAGCCPRRAGSRSTTAGIRSGTRSSRSPIRRRWCSHPTYDQWMAAPDLLGHLREQRSDEAPDRDRQRQRRPQRVLGVLGHRLRAGGSEQRGLQVRDQLRHLWADALTEAAFGSRDKYHRPRFAR